MPRSQKRNMNKRTRTGVPQKDTDIFHPCATSLKLSYEYDLEPGGLNKSLCNAPVAAKLRVTIKREHVLRLSKLRSSNHRLISNSKHRNFHPNTESLLSMYPPSFPMGNGLTYWSYSKRSRADINFDDELDTG
ncbi:hypothetical protein F5879DRAFT_927999 [Lentinula edodes]|uniref:uncharacterized protein n=1 Tax=Lentinula edodes TaxID=5353 RepID=UPI001E8E316C|nr:uncharacterized protein C8R40DRAFT_1065196 [Lentinula edodes]KAH7881542.1 hypothetical protein C8R40DRAFT_1065196 [Lentinula edodes]KAJ3897219.1 hypothetical protein F5879DRAFT_927999 [Lentinula edodes]